MDEISGIILSSVKINSEKREKIVPFLKDIKAKYGTPLAVVSDMGKGLIGAVEEVFPGILFGSTGIDVVKAIFFVIYK